MRLLPSLTLGAVAAAWVVTTAATAPHFTVEDVVSGTPHAECAVWAADGRGTINTTYGTPEWDRCMGAAAMYGEDGHEDTGDYTCWVEKVEDVATAEGICGPRGLRPAGSVELGSEVTVNGHQWVATVSGLEPIGAN
jgi:hypothetical protein